MFFITPISSETGKKFAAIKAKWSECFAAQKRIAAEIGFKQWRSAYGAVFGGISTVIFESEPDMSLWKSEGNKEYSPRWNNKAGKGIGLRFRNLPFISSDELNSCVGFDDPFNTIGYATSDDYAGIEIDEEWDIEMPSDCEEVTVSRYRQLFGKCKP